MIFILQYITGFIRCSIIYYICCFALLLRTLNILYYILHKVLHYVLCLHYIDAITCIILCNLFLLYSIFYYILYLYYIRYYILPHHSISCYVIREYDVYHTLLPDSSYICPYSPGHSSPVFPVVPSTSFYCSF